MYSIDIKEMGICFRKMPEHTTFLNTILRDSWIIKTIIVRKDNCQEP